MITSGVSLSCIDFGADRENNYLISPDLPEKKSSNKGVFFFSRRQITD